MAIAHPREVGPVPTDPYKAQSPPRIYGGLATLTLDETGGGVLCSDLGDLAEVSAATVHRLRLRNGARLHVRLLVGREDASGARPASLCKVLAWHSLRARVEEIDDQSMHLFTAEGLELVLPASYAREHSLEPGSVIEVIAAPTDEAEVNWHIVAVRRWAA